MATQYGTTRTYGHDSTEATLTSQQVQCKKCNVKAVPRGISSVRDMVAGKHCPNCGHVHGRDNH
jgi:hypothetical protein